MTRNPSRRSVLAAAGLSALAGTEALAQAPAPAAPPAPPRPRSPVVRGTLSQGAAVLCMQNDSSEIVSLVCLVRAGLPDERAAQAGIAAVTAEALLGGTERRVGAAFTRAVGQAGGNLRTVPGFDFTELTIVTSREQFPNAVRLLGEVVSRPAFSAEAVAQARETVKRRGLTLQDDFTGASYQTLMDQLYPDTPYGRPMNGYAETVDRITDKDVRDFWSQSYVQSRITLGIVGDVAPAAALAAAQEAFRELPAAPGAPPRALPEVVLARPRSTFLQRKGPASQVMAGFLAPGATRENFPVYFLLDCIVGGGKRARLFRAMREKESLGYDQGSFYTPLRLQSHLVGYVITPGFRRNPQTDQVESLVEKVTSSLLAQYRELAETGPTDTELSRARAFAMGRYALRQERTRDQAKWLAWNWAMGLGQDFDAWFNDRVAGVPKEQVQAAARRIAGQYAVVVTLQELG